jgi:hypothetical protein
MFQDLKQDEDCNEEIVEIETEGLLKVDALNVGVAFANLQVDAVYF